jgi:hypothetical protein
MKRLLPLFLICCIIHVAAQDTKTSNENKAKSRKSQSVTDLGDRLVLNLTSDNWMHQTEGMETKPFRSRGFSFLIMNGLTNQSGTFAWVLGLGISSQNVHSNTFPLDSGGTNYTSMNPFPSGTTYDLNKLSLNYLDAAFEIRLATHENNHYNRFKLNVGIKGGWLFQSHTKFDSGDNKIKTYDIENLNQFQYGITGRIAYAHWGICGYYSFLPIFKKDHGPNLIPYSIGISCTI